MRAGRSRSVRRLGDERPHRPLPARGRDRSPGASRFSGPADAERNDDGEEQCRGDTACVGRGSVGGRGSHHRALECYGVRGIPRQSPPTNGEGAVTRFLLFQPSTAQGIGGIENRPPKGPRQNNLSSWRPDVVQMGYQMTSHSCADPKRRALSATLLRRSPYRRRRSGNGQLSVGAARQAEDRGSSPGGRTLSTHRCGRPGGDPRAGDRAGFRWSPQSGRTGRADSARHRRSYRPRDSYRSIDAGCDSLRMRHGGLGSNRSPPLLQRYSTTFSIVGSSVQPFWRISSLPSGGTMPGRH